MSKNENWKKVAGLVLHSLIGGLMIVAGAAKVFGLVPPEEVAKLGLADNIRLIGLGELLTGIILLIPRTTSLGILLTSSFWGGAICIHMAHSEAYVAPAVLLVLSWAGAYLRNPATLSSFATYHYTTHRVLEKSEAILQQ